MYNKVMTGQTIVQIVMFQYDCLAWFPWLSNFDEPLGASQHVEMIIFAIVLTAYRFLLFYIIQAEHNLREFSLICEFDISLQLTITKKNDIVTL